MASINVAARTKLLLENYIEAKQSGASSGYDIKQVDPDNYEHYYILIQPKTGIYKGHSYVLELKTTYGHGEDATKYPINPPYAHFITDVYHTNISANGGSICVDILKQKEKWVPSYSFDAIVQNILMLFDEPNNASPYNGEASRMWVDCEKKFKERKSKLGKLTFADEEKLFEECFNDFRVAAAAFAKKNNLTHYSKWFPQLITDPKKQATAIEEAKIELVELTELLAMMKLKSKMKPVAKPDETKETNSSTTSNPDDKKAKPNRWAKYQKKP